MVKNSKLLDHLINVSKTELASGSDSLTTMGLLIASLDECCKNQEDCRAVYGDEVLETAHVLERFSESPEKILELLKKSVHTSENQLSDSITMQTRLFGAQHEADQQGKDILTADKMLAYLLSYPTDALKDFLSKENITVSPDNANTLNNNINLNSHDSKSETQDKSSGKEDTTELSDSYNSLSDIFQKTKELREKLSSLIFGQDHAIQTMVSGYFRSEITAIMTPNHTQPRALFLFAGMPGVGKTYLAESAAKILDLPYARFDMSEYSSPQSTIEFSGADKTYQSAAPGNVTGFVANHPQCILLFDEIEKASTPVIHLFLQILDAGKIRDSYTDKEVSFKDTIIIFTTNAGRPLYENSDSGNFSDTPRKVILKALENDVNPNTKIPYFPTAICSRLATGNLVMFNQMDAHDLREIVKQEMLSQSDSFEKVFNISVEIEEDVYTALLFAEGGDADARTIRSQADMFFEEELYELVRLTNTDATVCNTDNIKTIHITAQIPETGSIRQLFHSDEAENLLVFASPDVVNKCQSFSSAYHVIGAQTIPDAKNLLSNNEFQLIFIDPVYGRKKETEQYLNIEDVDSDSRDLLLFVRKHYPDIPVYILETQSFTTGVEELISYQQAGVWGTINLEANDFSQTLQKISEKLHQQASMKNLSKGNTLVSYETGQSVSEDGTIAEITLFDFTMQTAVDPDETDNILSDISTPDVHFDQVIGAQDAKDELQYFVEYLKDPKKYRKYGGHVPRGVILYGPPGTGKTTLAKAMACEADVTFIAAEGNQFLKRYVGEGPEKVHDLFRIARKYAPTILFVDEIDAIASDRRYDNSSRSDILTAFLNEMDGFANDPTRPVFVLAATNLDTEPGSPTSLDPALMRRFDRRIYVDLPDKKARIQYLKMKINENHFFSISDEEIENLAVRSTGMSLATLESVLDTAMRITVRTDSDTVTDSILEEAFDTQNFGEEKKWDASELERTARHEAGHAYVNWKGGETPAYITVVARGNYGGYMQHDDNENKHNYTKNELLSRIRTSMGGRAAEIVYYGEEDGLSTGPSGDLENATHYAEQILCTYGMDPEFGMAVINLSNEQSPEMSMEIRNAVNAILSRELENAIQIIRDGRDDMDKIVNALIEKDHMTGKEFEALLK